MANEKDYKMRNEKWETKKKSPIPLSRDRTLI